MASMSSRPKFLHSLTQLFLLTVALGSFELACAQEFKFVEIKVVDENGKPLEDVPVNFRMGGLDFPMPTDKLGMVSLNVPGGDERFEIKVEQPGYAPQKKRWSRGTDVPNEYVMKMALGKPFEGVVRDLAGNALPGVRVSYGMADEPLEILNSQFPSKMTQPNSTTGADGKFSLPFRMESPTIVCLAKQGWAQLDADEGPLDIQLRTWAKVKGSAKLGDSSGWQQEIEIRPSRWVTPAEQTVIWKWETTADKNGEFSLDSLVEGRFSIAARVASLAADGSEPIVSSHHVFTELTAGATSEVAIGGNGRTVTGAVVIQKPNQPGSAPPYGTIQLQENKVVSNAVSSLFYVWGQANQPVRADGRIVVGDTSEMQGPPASSYWGIIDGEGRFTIEHVPPGQYVVTTQVYSPLKKQLGAARKVLKVECKANCAVLAETGDASAAVDISSEIADHTNIATTIVELD